MAGADVLLINYTEVPLKYFVRGFNRSPIIAPEMYDTLDPERKITLRMYTPNEILLKWSFDGRRYGEVIRVKDDMTLRLEFSDDIASIQIREWGGIRFEEGWMAKGR